MTTARIDPVPTAAPVGTATPVPSAAGQGTQSFAAALATAGTAAQTAPPVPDLAPAGAPPSITLAAALGLTPPVPVYSGTAAASSAAGGAVTTVAASAPAAPVGTGWKARLPAAGRRWADAIEAAAGRHGVDPRLLAALVRAESGFRQEARSHAGAIGLAQLMPGTARGLGVDPYDPVENLEGGARFLKAMKDRFGSDELALAAYNAGPGRVQRAGGIPDIRETRAYVPKVMRFYRELRS